jgi:hypothetical protein
MKKIEQALLDFIDVFNELELSYAIMGGMAVRAHSIPRPTWDVDLLIAVERESLAKVFTAVEERGYTVPDAYRGGWVDRVADMPLVKFRVYLEGGGVDVDVFLAEDEYQQELLLRSRPTETDVGRLNVVTPEDLVLLKLLASRPRDLIDVADLLFIQGPMDVDYMRKWARRLGIADRLEDVLSNPPTERP